MICFCKSEMNSINIGKSEYFLCSSCGYLRKKYEISDVEQKKRYDNHICDSGYLKYMNKIYSNISRYLNKGVCLDYGCGQIHALSDILNANGYECDYYDLFYYPKLEKKKYDNIILIEVFEHIIDPLKLFRDLKNILNKNGRIIIMTQIIPEKIDDWWYLRDSTHVSFVTFKAMDILAKIYDMKVEYILDKALFVFSCI